MGARAFGPRSDLWLCPTPGAEWRAIAQPETFDALFAGTRALQLYHGQLFSPTSTPAEYHHPNNAALFRELGVLPRAAVRGLQLALEGPALKAWNDDPRGYIEMWRVAIAEAAAQGHAVDWAVFDEPLYASLVEIKPAWTRARILDHVRNVFNGVRGLGPHVILTEAYPTVTVDQMKWMLEALPWDGFHLDVDYRHATSRRDGLRLLLMDMARLQRTCNDNGVSHGLIVWGYDETSDATWAGSARTLLAAIQQAVHRAEMTWPHRLIVQSWSANGTAPRVMPPTVPASNPNSLWALLDTVKQAV